MFILSSKFWQNLHEAHILHCTVNLRTYNYNYMQNSAMVHDKDNLVCT